MCKKLELSSRLKWTLSLGVVGFGAAGLCVVLRRPASIPHSYSITTKLGVYKRLSVSRVMQRIESGSLFPLHMQGSLNGKNSSVNLHLQGTQWLIPPNQVTMIDRSETEEEGSILLEAGEGKHMFKGYAEHKLKKEDSGLFTYTVKGEGIEGEEVWRKLLNMMFAQYMWPTLIKYNVVPGMKKLALEEEEEGGQTTKAD